VNRARHIYVSPSGHTCPVYHRADVRLRPSGKLYQHSMGPAGGPVPVAFAVCRGSNGPAEANVGLAGVADAHFAAVRKELERDES
jgi:hypothetical protein